MIRVRIDIRRQQSSSDCSTMTVGETNEIRVGNLQEGSVGIGLKITCVLSEGLDIFISYFVDKNHVSSHKNETVHKKKRRDM